MGRYHDDDFEREDDYRSWLYYRESSHEERELQRKQARSNEKQTSNNPEPVIPPVDWPVSMYFATILSTRRALQQQRRNTLNPEKRLMLKMKATVIDTVFLWQSVWLA